MNRRLPSLSMLRTFEATARLGSFTRAADQLNMTQGAVSYQVRMLEEHLGIKLFLRTPRKLVLTLDGDKLAHSLIRAFGALATALDEVCPSLSKDRLSVTVFTSFATKWLVPRLRGFHQTHPQINLRILGEDKPVDPSEFDHDVGIRYGRGKWNGLEARLLHDDVVFPVCSPRLLAEHRIDTVGDLANISLLNEESRNLFDDGADWEAWFRRAAPEAFDERPDCARPCRIRYTHASLALQAAIEGQGVALTNGFLVADDLASGRLVRPLDVTVRADCAYYLVRRPTKPMTKCARSFCDWLMAEIRQTKSYLQDAIDGAPAGITGGDLVLCSD
jgi:LysR family glycine cleavage system transcriptional activator